MSTATPFPSQERASQVDAVITFRTLFEGSPLPAARFNQRGEIIEMNPACARIFGDSGSSRHESLLWEWFAFPDRSSTQMQVRELCEGERDSVCIPANGSGAGAAGMSWTGWRMSSGTEQGGQVVFVADPMIANAGPVTVEPSEKSLSDLVPDEPALDQPVSDESALQAQRWEAVGRLVGGVVHDFNNLLTGVMLYCDLLLSSFDTRDRRRRYAEEIRGAIMQATGLVQQLLVFARPQAAQVRSLLLNEIATSMRNLLVRLIGENIELELRLDPDLALVKIDHAQAQQILLNLVLNARDALPDGGRITIETSNCKFQPVAGAPTGTPAFPCVLLVVSDNGCGMDFKTRQRLFEPFFTTKSSGKGTGLGLTTVRSIVTTNRGLIHLESEAGRGTRAMILLPRALSAAVLEDEAKPGMELLQSAQRRSPYQVQQDSANQDSNLPSTSTFSAIKKESKL
jgi:signal transduction histidine kinase